ncbi:hypothetical protein Fmac_006707 [Flemingia macrophylla]|uniref:UDP-glucuronate decarboxylase n=1 Tax=Flemingia macrophylla TaxID=520843 RepID=A0ABD1NCK7_9FABA
MALQSVLTWGQIKGGSNYKDGDNNSNKCLMVILTMTSSGGRLVMMDYRGGGADAPYGRRTIDTSFSMADAGFISGLKCTGRVEGETEKGLSSVVQETIYSEAKIEFKPNTEDDPHKRKADISRAKEQLGWEPKVDAHPILGDSL